MKVFLLILVILLSGLSAQLTNAQAPATRQSSAYANNVGATMLVRLREKRSDLFQKAIGVLVVGVVIGSQADAAGIRLTNAATSELGDVLVSYAGQPLDSAESFATKVKEQASSTQDIELGVIRNQALVTIKLRPGSVGLYVRTVKVDELELVKRTTSEFGTSVVDEKHEIFVQLGHSKNVNAIAFSPDGHMIASGSDDNTVKLWDAISGRELRTLRESSTTKHVESVAFSPDGKSLATASRIGGIKIWDPTTGKMLRDGGSAISASKVLYSPDGRLLISTRGGEIVFWDAQSFQRLRSIRPEAGSKALAISVNGRMLASIDGDHAIKIWDVDTGNEIQTLSGKTTILASIAFSPNGHVIASGGIDGRIKLWDVKSGLELRSIDTSFKSPIPIQVIFSPDSSRVIGGGYPSDNKPVKAWDVSTGKEQRYFSNAGGFHGTAALQLSPDGHILASAGSGDDILQWDVISGERLVAMTKKLPSSWVGRAASPDGKIVAFGGKSIKLLDATTGRELRVIELPKVDGKEVYSSEMAFSPDGQTLASVCGDNLIRLFDVKNGKELIALRSRDFPQSIVFSPNGKSLAAATLKYSGENSSSSIIFWDVTRGQELSSPGRLSNVVSGMAFSTDGRKFAFSTIGGPITVWDLVTGGAQRTLKTEFSWASSLAFSPDGGTLAAGNTNQTIDLWDVTNGNPLRVLKGHTRNVTALNYSADGRTLVSGSEDASLKVWDIQTGSDLRTLSGHSGDINSIILLRDGRALMTSSIDGSVRKWSLTNGRQTAMFVAFSDGAHLTITPEGYFNASSPQAAENLNIRKGMNVYGIDQFYDVFYRPDIVEAALAGRDTSDMVALTIGQALKSTPPQVDSIRTTGSSVADAVKFTYRIKSTGGGIGDVRVFHNGKLIQSDGVARAIPNTLLGKKTTQITGEVLEAQMRNLAFEAVKNESLRGAVTSAPKPDLYESEVDIEPVPGENNISVIAFNAQNSIQSVARTTRFISSKPSVAPRLHILAIGVDEYKDKSVSLAFAVKDSRDIAARWKAQATNIYGAQNIFVETISNAQASREGILTKINQLAVRVKPTDHFVLFIASHGVLLGDQYYMVTSDYDGQLQPSKLIGANEIVDVSRRIKALSQVYILDTCHAGGMGGVVSGLYDARVSVLAKQMGLHVFASASSSEEAIDGFEGNGLFTHTLLAGLNNNKVLDTNADKKVSMVELGTYSKNQTRDIAKKQRHKQDPVIINFGQDNPVYLLQ